MGPRATRRNGGRQLHLQHGPIDLLIETEDHRETAFLAAETRFASILDELVAELPALGTEVADTTPPPSGPVAGRMHAATLPHAGVFITRMASVAGAVADEILAAMQSAASLTRAFVNNGGDIAFHLERSQNFTVQMSAHDGTPLGSVAISGADGIGGLATSGWRGRSHSLGIADSVTVLAKSAAAADVAATLIANAIDLPDHPGIHRTPAQDLWPDSDLGGRLATTGCATLAPTEVAKALDQGEAVARDMQARGLLLAAALFLQGQARFVGKGAFFPRLTTHSPDQHSA